MAIVMENAGAQKGILLLQQNSVWVVAATASIEVADQVELPYLPTTEYRDLPHSMINYIQSTHSTVILAEAQKIVDTSSRQVRQVGTQHGNFQPLA